MKNKEKKLYIIGNGFDLHHNLKTSYYNFKKFIKTINPSFVKRFDDFMTLYCDDFKAIKYWNTLEDFTQFMTNVNYSATYESVMENAEQDPTKIQYFEEPEYYFLDEINEIIEYINRFTEFLPMWIKSIESSIGNIFRDDNLNLDKNAYYLSFNYTSTLEKIYDIDKENILYIHRKNNKLIFGHNRSKKDIYEELSKINRSKYIRTSFDDIGVSSVVKAMFKTEDHIDINTNKNSNLLIKENLDFFNKINNIEELIIMGVSFGEQDKVYFDFISQNLNESCNIKIYLHNANVSVKENIMKTFKNKITFIDW